MSTSASDGSTLGLGTQGLCGYTAVVLVVTLKAALETNSWTFLNHIVTWGSIASWFIFLLIYCESVIDMGLQPPQYSWYRVYRTFGMAQVWLSIILAVVLALAR
eukprot:Hpha_TRINITY_DN16024_c4_g1::TRINITY_DN16024_c4_g1_i1::g.122342::m.122342